MTYEIYSHAHNDTKVTMLRHLYKNKCKQIELSKSPQTSLRVLVLKAEADALKAELDTF
jgi:hypothetical protein